MDQPTINVAFTGSVPQIYERYLVPLIFEPYAQDIAARVAALKPSRVLEIAAGTGAVTRYLARQLPADTAIIATDLNQAMLDQAAKQGINRPVEWRQADAMQLPFADGSMDAIVCQFGVMFFPDKTKAFAEAKRVLRPGGTFIFNVWDKLEENEITYTLDQAISAYFANDPPRFIEQIPHGYYDHAKITQDLAQGGFSQTPQFVVLSHRSRASSAQIPAIAFCQGTPLRSEIEKRAPAGLNELTELTTRAIEKKFGSGSVEGKIQAHIVIVKRD